MLCRGSKFSALGSWWGPPFGIPCTRDPAMNRPASRAWSAWCHTWIQNFPRETPVLKCPMDHHLLPPNLQACAFESSPLDHVLLSMRSWRGKAAPNHPCKLTCLQSNFWSQPQNLWNQPTPQNLARIQLPISKGDPSWLVTTDTCWTAGPGLPWLWHLASEAQALLTASGKSSWRKKKGARAKTKHQLTHERFWRQCSKCLQSTDSKQGT